jgi:predicted GNAT family acetyltransferase
MKTVERHKKTDFGDVWYVNAADGTYRFAVYKYDDDDDTIYLSNVFVKEDSRRQGYGNEILASAEDYANRLGASVICLKVLSGSDVHRWYKRHGYEDLEKDEEERGYMWMKKELKKIDESHWSEMNRRSQGISVRKEDSVDLLNADDFVSYIRKNYKIDNTPFDIGIASEEIVIPLFVSGKGRISMWGLYFEYKEDVVCVSRSISKHIPKLLNKLDTNFDLWVDEPEYENFIIINPKDTNRKITNSYVIEVLNFIIDNLDDTVTPCIFRKTNESHWSEMNRRSQGTAVRKEDDLDTYYKNLISGHIIDSFSENLVYIETTINNIYSFKRFAKDLLTHYIENDEVSAEAIDLYIDNHWNEFSKTINEKVQEEKDYVKSTGFQKYMFSSIKTSFDDWWKKLDENDQEDLVYYFNQTAEEMDYDTYKDADEIYSCASMREKLYGWK